MDSFKLMSAPALRSFMAGQNLMLTTTIPHHIVKKFPSEIMILQHQYDKALNTFNKRIKELQKENKNPEDKIEIPENRKAILFRMNKEKQEGGCK